MTKLRLDRVRKELAGFWDSAQAAVWMRAAESACSSEDWATATKRLLSLADVTESLPSGSDGLRELAATTLETVVRTDDAALVRETAARVLERAWTAAEMPDVLQGALRVAHAIKADGAGEALGAVLESRFPHWPHGPYASADFRERLARRKLAQPRDADALASRFLRAGELFENRGDAAAAAHCRLRAAALLADFTGQSDRARELARSVDAASLSASDRLWLAHVQAQSPFWLDRVRAADFVCDVLEGADRGDPAFEAWTKEDALSVGRLLFERLPSSPQDVEVDRLETALTRVEGPERWELEAQLRGRLSVAQFAEVALDDLDLTVAKELEHDALPLRGFLALVEAWHGRPVTMLPTEPVPRAVVETLRALDGETEARAEALEALASAVVDASDSAALRPVALVFARLLTRKIEDPREEAAATQIALHYIRRGTAPSFGFWALAANLFRAGLQRAAAAAVERALAAGEAGPRNGEDLIARAVQWAVREGSDQQMLMWLEVGREQLRE